MHAEVNFSGHFVNCKVIAGSLFCITAFLYLIHSILTNLWCVKVISLFFLIFCFQVEKKREEDAANGVQIAKSLEGFVQRKVCDI